MLDNFSIQLGFALIELGNPQRSGSLLARVRDVRENLSAKLGLTLEPVYIHDNLVLDRNTYRILHRDVLIDRGVVFPGKFMTTGAARKPGDVSGRYGFDPIRKCNTIWIDGWQKNIAITRGWTVLDATSVIAQHLEQVVRQRARIESVYRVPTKARTEIDLGERL